MNFELKENAGEGFIPANLSMAEGKKAMKRGTRGPKIVWEMK